MQTKPFIVFQPTPGRTSPKPLFVVHCYDLDQARAIVTARVVGKTIVVDAAALDARQ
jgi:hypothetical protein